MSWNSLGGADYYKIHHDNDSALVSPITGPIHGTNIIITGLNNDQTYNLAVIAYDEYTILWIPFVKTSSIEGSARASATPRGLVTAYFDTDEGTSINSYETGYDTLVSKPQDPTKIGFSFKGWYHDLGFTDDWDFGNDRITSDVDIYAMWESTGFVFTDITFEDGVYGELYREEFKAEGGVGPYEYTLGSSGDLPDGFSITDEGELVGETTEVGVFNFTIDARDTTTNSEVTADCQITIQMAGDVSAPYASSENGEINYGVEVSLDTSTTDAIIYYTIDGTDPTIESDVYDSEIEITQYTLLKMIATRAGMYDSEIVTYEYEIMEHGVTYDVGTVSEGEAPFDEEIYKMSDEVTLKELGDVVNSGYKFAGWILEDDDTESIYIAGDLVEMEEEDLVLKASWVRAELEFEGKDLNAGTVGLSYEDLVFASGGSGKFKYEVSTGDFPEGLVLASDGMISGTPSLMGDYFFSIEVIDDGDDVVVNEFADYYINIIEDGIVEVPTADVEEGEIERTDKVGLSSITDDVVIYYTTDGSTPTEASNLYKDGIVIDEDKTIKAIAVRSGWSFSEISTFKYTVKKYSITYDVGEAKNIEIPVDESKYGKEEIAYLKSLSDANNVGYDFVGWTIKNSEDGEIIEVIEDDLSLNMFTKDITIEARWVATPVEFFGRTIMSGTKGTEYYNVLEATGGSGKFIYKVAEGSNMPAGLVISEAGEISGVPTTHGELEIPVVVVDSVNGQTVTAYFTINIANVGNVTKPISNFESGYINKGDKIELSINTENAVIYYTLDGTIPTADSIKYEGSIKAKIPMNINAIAIRTGFVDSLIASYDYKINSYKISYDLGGAEGIAPRDIKNYQTTDLITLVELPDVKKEGYTFSGWMLSSDKTRTIYQPGEMAPMGSEETVIIANWMAAKMKFDGGGVPSGSYGVEYSEKILASEGSGSFKYYLIDGGLLPEGIELLESGELKGIPVSTGEFAFDVTAIDRLSKDEITAEIILDIAEYGVTATPIFEKNTKYVERGEKILVSSSTEGAELFYTVDKKTPKRYSRKYNDGIKIYENTTIKVIASKPGLDESVVLSKYFKIKGHKLRYDTQTDIESVSTDEYYKGEKIVLKDIGDVTKDGYYFAGWSYDNGVRKRFYKPGDVVTVGEEDVVIVARWKKVIK